MILKIYKTSIILDLALIISVIIVSAFFVLDAIQHTSQTRFDGGDVWYLGQLHLSLFVLVICLAWFSFRRWQASRVDTSIDTPHYQKMLLEAQTKTSPDGILVVSKDREWLSFNQRFAEMWDLPPRVVDNYDKDESLQIITAQLKEPERFFSRIEDIYENLHDQVYDEVALKDGRVFERYSSPIKDENELYYGRVWYTRDITERKQAQQAKEEFEKLLQATVDGLSAAIALLDDRGEIKLVNSAWRKFAIENGAEVDAVSEGQNYLDICDNAVGPGSEDAKLFAAGIRKVFSGELSSFNLEYDFLPGQPSWFTASVTPYRDGDSPRVVVAHENITERKLVENRLRLLDTAISQISEAIVITTSDLEKPGPEILYVNPAFTRMTGYAAEEVLGKTPRTLQGPQTDRRVLNQLRHHLAQGKVFKGETINYRKDGTEFVTEWRITPIQDSQGDITHFVSVQSDITEEKRMMDALHESEEQFRQVIASISDHIYITKIPENGDNSNVYISPNIKDLVGYSEEKFLTDWKFWNSQLIVSDDREAAAAQFQRLTSGQDSEVEYRMVRSDGQMIWIRDSARVIDQDSTRLIYGVVSDITKRKQIEEELHKSTEAELQRRNRELTLLNQIIVTSATHFEQEAILEIACRELALTFDVSRAVAILLNQEKTEGRIVAEYLTEEQGSVLHQSFPVKGNPIVEYLLSYKMPLVIGEAESDPRLVPLSTFMQRQGTASLLILPLIVEGELIGGLRLASVEPKAFARDELVLAWSVAEQVSGALTRIRYSEARRLLSTAVEQSTDIIMITDTEGTIVYVNPAFENVTGYTPNEAIGQTFDLLKSDQHKDVFYQTLWDTILAGEVWGSRMINKRKDGSLYTVDSIITPVRDPYGEIINYVALQRDITHRLELEDQLQRSQKMEAVGRLAGGIAHDFNNLLTVINGYVELLAKSYLNSSDPRQRMVGEVRKAGQQAAVLTRQLLAFSRQQPTFVQPLNLNQVVTTMKSLLARLLGEHLTLEIDLATDLDNVLLDPSQIEQVIMNLAINARDAMPDGGTLTFMTANTMLDENHHINVIPGPYIELCIADTGEGMDQETQNRVFEPFFTTKIGDQGTGLGLSIVYSIVEQNNGHIQVESTLGQGTTFKIYLPRTDETIKASPLVPEHPISPIITSNKTILLVEDEAGVRLIIQEFLENQGFTVLVASNSREALEICQQKGQELDLLITDVIMPNISGPELAKQLTQFYPNLKILFISGYTDQELESYKLDSRETFLLEKPFSSQVLINKVQEVLGS